MKCVDKQDMGRKSRLRSSLQTRGAQGQETLGKRLARITRAGDAARWGGGWGKTVLQESDVRGTGMDRRGAWARGLYLMLMQANGHARVLPGRCVL